MVSDVVNNGKRTRRDGTKKQRPRIPPNKGAVDRLTPDTIPYVAFIAGHPGIGVRVKPDGSKHVISLLRINGARTYHDHGRITTATPFLALFPQAKKRSTAATEAREERRDAPGVPTLGEVRRQYHAMRQLSSATANDYEKRWRYLSDLHNQPTTKIDIKAFITGGLERTRERGRDSFYGTLRYLKALLTFDAEARGVPAYWPSGDLFTIPQSKKRTPHAALSDQEFMRKVATLLYEMNTPASRAMLFCLLSGWRKSNVIGLTSAMLGPSGTVMLSTKTGPLSVPVSDAALALLHRGVGKQFPISPDALRTPLAKVKKALGLHLTPHDARRFFKSVGIGELEIDRSKINRLVGHVEQGLDASYVASSTRRLRDAANEIAEWLVGHLPLATQSAAA